jgi:N-acetylglutamate synthase-like GNAT family acetyltransferase
LRHIRRYIEADRDACLAIFGSNIPTFFRAHEQPGFASFLEQHGDRYFVVDDANRIVACGGWGWKTEKPRVARLCWGMVHRDSHRRGLGTLLLAHRLEEIAKHDFDEVEVNTSQHAAAFFVRAGFVEVAVQPDSYGPGLHGHRMRLSAYACRRR